ncbi:MAG: flagellar basal-body rod protein FlgF [Lachnospirales bacterium]
MNRSLYTGAVGMMTQMKIMDVTSNNIANVNTTGYKTENVVTRSFDEELMIRIKDLDIAENNLPFPNVGTVNLGVTVDEVYTDFSTGSFQTTDNPFDLAIDGDGFFEVLYTNDDGETQSFYTRDGSFTVNHLNQLTTKDGYLVSGENGPITIVGSSPYIAEDGSVYDGNEIVDKISLVIFEDNGYLRQQGDNLYSTLEGATIANTNASVVQGMLENSNANAVKEMVNLINISRTYEANQKVVSTSDTLLGKAVNDIARKV